MTWQEAQQAIQAEPGLVHDEYTQKNLSLDVASELDGSARLLGKTIRFVDSIAEGAAQGENAGSEIRIAKDAEDPVRYVYGHEIGHTLKNAAPEEYQRLQTLIAPEIGDAVEEIQREYQAKGVTLSEAAALDELTNNYIGELTNDTDALQRFVERHTTEKSLLRRLRDAVAGLLRRLHIRNISEQETGRNSGQRIVRLTTSER